MDDKDTRIDHFFINSKLLKLKLINYIIGYPFEKLPISKDIASTYKISNITAKKIVSQLAQENYLKSNKKGGTKIIGRFSKVQLQVFEQAKDEIKRQIETLEKNNFNAQEILSCLYSSLHEYNFDNAETKIIYTEEDPEIVFMGARELSDLLNIKIKPIYYENLTREVLSNSNSIKAVITPFYSVNKLKNLSGNVKIFPIHTAYPLGALSSSKNIASNSTLIYVAVSDEDKERALYLKNRISTGIFNLKIYRIDELLENERLLDSADIVVAFKWIINNNEKIFKNVPKIIAYNRFDDRDGILLIKNFIDSINSNIVGG